MGAPKQKWTSEEEAALKAGVTKYGAGKWSTILKDPEFCILLYSRSNVDLKDKWRNMNVAANGWGSRSRVRVTPKSNQQIVKDDDKALITVSQSDTEIVDAQPLAVSNGTPENASSKKPIPRLDNLILEAITNLKEPRGSSRAAIGIYIEVKHQFRIAPPSTHTDVNKGSSPLILEGKQKNSPKVEKNEIKILSKSQIDAELEKMKGMTAQEAAAAAAQAVAEAEAAIAEAEEAAREAEKAEAEAEEAQLFAEAAMKALKCRTVCT